VTTDADGLLRLWRSAKSDNHTATNSLDEPLFLKSGESRALFSKETNERADLAFLSSPYGSILDANPVVNPSIEVNIA
jgi:hypothetical protein